jgi:hypothetical protein
MDRTQTRTRSDLVDGMKASFLGVLGYRRSRRNILGKQARLVTIRGGVLSVRDERGTEHERVPVRAATVELKRGLVKIAADGREFFLYGLADVNAIPRQLARMALAEPAEVTIAPAFGGLIRAPLGAAAASRATRDVLLAQGARPR